MSLEITTWNMEHGFVDAMMRGWRSTFLSDLEYSNLKEGGRRGGAGDGGGKVKEDFEDIRLTLQETDYGNFLSADPMLDPKLIGQRATQKWVREMLYFRATATGQLARFLDYIRFEYMIDNILDLIKAATSVGTATGAGATIDVSEVVANLHPLGLLDSGTMKTILAFTNLGEEFFKLYKTVLVETPVGKYFSQFLNTLVEEKHAADIGHVRTTYTEIPMTIIENSIKKLYLEDFYAFCQEVGGETAELMGELLATRADLLTVNITVNSLRTDLSRSGKRTTRSSLFPCIGHLYPEGCERLERAEDEEAVAKALADSYPDYGRLWESALVDSRGMRDLSQVFFSRTVRQLELAFDGQFHFASFYAYAKLKEQEVKNIQWIATCLEHGMYSEVDRIIPIFSATAATAAPAGRVAGGAGR